MKTGIIYIVALVALVGVFSAFQTKAPSGNDPMKKGMIKVTILYPNGEGKKFDMDYYSNKHMPMLAELFGDQLKQYEIDKGISGRTPADPVPYLAIGYLYFETLSAYQEIFKANVEKIRGDVQNYTNIQPIVQISEVVK